MKMIAFVLFYMASCPHCQRFDPILKSYAVHHHVPVLAYTLDSRSLPSFPQSLTPSPAELRHFFPHGNVVVPTVFVMDLKHHKIEPLLQGEATAMQLDARMRGAA